MGAPERHSSEGPHWGTVAWERDADAQGRLYKEVLTNAAPGSVEVHYEWPDGRAAWIEIDAFPVPDGVAIFYRDIRCAQTSRGGFAGAERDA